MINQVESERRYWETMLQAMCQRGAFGGYSVSWNSDLNRYTYGVMLKAQ